MPKTKGLTSIEVAILVATVIVIAVATGWYLYTTFLALTQTQTKLSITQAIYYSNGTLALRIYNVGQTDVSIAAVYLGKHYCNPPVKPIPAGAHDLYVAQCPKSIAQPNTVMEGVLIASDGKSFPFTAQVRLS